LLLLPLNQDMFPQLPMDQRRCDSAAKGDTTPSSPPLSAAVGPSAAMPMLLLPSKAVWGPGAAAASASAAAAGGGGDSEAPLLPPSLNMLLTTPR
jgi:hypothetical protein